jgi:two-component system, sensor histidine kinase and response regulator
MSNILVIEDEDNIRDTICEMLRAENHNVVEAEDGKIGVELAKEAIPDLVICDVMMPELDGYTVLYHLREDPSTQTVPFIFLSAKSAKEDMRLGMDLGGDDYLTKPFTRQELLSAITTRLAKQQAIEREAEQKLDELRANITHALPHELRTPLNGIINNAKLLKDNYDDTEREEALQMLKEIYISGERLFRLVQNFLLYAELSRIQQEPRLLRALIDRKEQCFPCATIKEIAIQRATRSNRQSDLHFQLQDAAISLSSSTIKKIAEEIIDNAFKFSKPGTQVQIRTYLEDNTFNLFIIDNGRGMTAEQIDNLGAYMQFERKIYAQNGSGLGLTLARMLLELHGGSLRIESIPGKQTIVHIQANLAVGASQ